MLYMCVWEGNVSSRELTVLGFWGAIIMWLFPLARSSVGKSYLGRWLEELPVCCVCPLRNVRKCTDDHAA